MKNIKSHFWYTKSQRNGVFFLLIIIILLQIGYFSLNYFYKSEGSSFLNNETNILLQSKIDSLKLVKHKAKSKIYPFNPNFISDYKGYKLGMSIQEIDRLHSFRAQNKYVNSKEEFQKVTKVSNALLDEIAPYFKFPDWVVAKQKKNIITKTKDVVSVKYSSEIKELSTTDINLATANDFTTIIGVGESLSKRIINYRNKLQGFSYSYQLNEVWGIDSDIVVAVLKTFKVKEKPNIIKININTASFKEVLRTPYIDYELCKEIFNYRDEVAELQSISELKKIQGFPLNKYNRIVLYLKAN